MWVRGLKLVAQARRRANDKVAPYVGAWIETRIFVYYYNTHYVAPYVGAWIETLDDSNVENPYTCRTLCGCVD